MAQKVKDYVPKTAVPSMVPQSIVPKSVIPDSVVPTSIVPKSLLPFRYRPYTFKPHESTTTLVNPDDPFEINSLADIILTTFDPKMKSKYSTPILNILPRYLEYSKNYFWKPALSGRWGQVGINFLNNASETVDVFANPVKALVQGGNVLDAMGWGGRGRTSYDFNTGSWATDMVLEVLCDPGTYLSGGMSLVGHFTKNGTKEVATPAVKKVVSLLSTQLADDIGEEASEAVIKNITKRITREVVESGGQELGESVIKKVLHEVSGELAEKGINSRLLRTHFFKKTTLGAADDLATTAVKTLATVIKQNVDVAVKEVTKASDLAIINGVSKILRVYDQIDVSLTGAALFGAPGATAMWYTTKGLKGAQTAIDRASLKQFIPYMADTSTTFTNWENLVQADVVRKRSFNRAYKALTGQDYNTEGAAQWLKKAADEDLARLRQFVFQLKDSSNPLADLQKYMQNYHKVNSLEEYVQVIKNANTEFDGEFDRYLELYQNLSEDVTDYVKTLDLAKQADELAQIDKVTRRVEDAITYYKYQDDLLKNDAKIAQLPQTAAAKAQATEQLITEIKHYRQLNKPYTTVDTLVKNNRYRNPFLLKKAQLQVESQLYQLRKTLQTVVPESEDAAKIINQRTVLQKELALLQNTNYYVYSTSPTYQRLFKEMYQPQLSKELVLNTDGALYTLYKTNAQHIHNRLQELKLLQDHDNFTASPTFRNIIAPQLWAPILSDLEAVLQETSELVQPLVSSNAVEYKMMLTSLEVETAALIHSIRSGTESSVNMDSILNIRSRINELQSVFDTEPSLNTVNLLDTKFADSMLQAKVVDILRQYTATGTKNYNDTAKTISIRKKHIAESIPLFEDSLPMELPDALSMIDDALGAYKDTDPDLFNNVRTFVQDLYYVKTTEVTPETLPTVITKLNNLSDKADKIIRDIEVTQHDALGEVYKRTEQFANEMREIINKSRVDAPSKEDVAAYAKMELLRLEKLTNLGPRQKAKLDKLRNAYNQYKYWQTQPYHAQWSGGGALPGTTTIQKRAYALQQTFTQLGLVDSKDFYLDAIPTDGSTIKYVIRDKDTTRTAFGSFKMLSAMPNISYEKMQVDVLAKGKIYGVHLEQVTSLKQLMDEEGGFSQVKTALKDSKSPLSRFVRQYITADDEVGDLCRQLQDAVQLVETFERELYAPIMAHPLLSKETKTSLVSLLQHGEIAHKDFDYVVAGWDQFVEEFLDRADAGVITRQNYESYRVEAILDHYKKSGKLEVMSGSMHDAGMDVLMEKTIAEKEIPNFAMGAADTVDDIETTSFKSTIDQITEYGYIDANNNIIELRVKLDRNNPAFEPDFGAMQVKFPELDTEQAIRDAYFDHYTSKSGKNIDTETIAYAEDGVIKQVQKQIIWCDSEEDLLHKVITHYDEVRTKGGTIRTFNGDKFDLSYVRNRITRLPDLPSTVLAQFDELNTYDILTVIRQQKGITGITPHEQDIIKKLLEQYRESRKAFTHTSQTQLVGKFIVGPDQRVSEILDELKDLIIDSAKTSKGTVDVGEVMLKNTGHIGVVDTELIQQLRQLSDVYTESLTAVKDANKRFNDIWFTEETVKTPQVQAAIKKVMVEAISGKLGLDAQKQVFRQLFPFIPEDEIETFAKNRITTVTKKLQKKIDLLDLEIANVEQQLNLLHQNPRMLRKHPNAAKNLEALLHTKEGQRAAQLTGLLKYKDSLQGQIKLFKDIAQGNTVKLNTKTQEKLLKEFFGVAELSNIDYLDKWLDDITVGRLFFGKASDVTEYGITPIADFNLMRNWLVMPQADLPLPQMRRLYRLANTLENRLARIKDTSILIPHADAIKQSLEAIQQHPVILANFGGSLPLNHLKISDTDLANNYVWLKYWYDRLNYSRTNLKGIATDEQLNQIIAELIPDRDVLMHLKHPDRVQASLIPGSKDPYVTKAIQRDTKMSDDITRVVHNAEIIESTRHMLDSIESFAEELEVRDLIRPSVQKLSHAAQATYDFFELIQDTANSMKFYQQVAVSNYFTEIQKHLKTQTFLNAVTYLQEPEDAIKYVANAGGLVTFSQKEVQQGLFGSERLSQKPVAKILSRRKEFEAIGLDITLDKTGRVYITFNENVDFKAAINPITRKKELYLNGQLLDKLQINELDIAAAFKHVPLAVPDLSDVDALELQQLLLDRYKTARSNMHLYTDRASVGTSLETFNEAIYDDLLTHLPTEVRAKMKMMDDDTRTAFFSELTFNLSNLGQLANQKEMQTMVINGLTTTLGNTTKAVVQASKAENLYVNMLYGDPMLKLSEMLKTVPDDLFLQQMKNNPQMIATALVQDAKAPRGYKVVNVPLQNQADLQQALRLNASIIPIQTFSKVSQAINTQQYNHGFLKAWKRIVGVYKVGMLFSPGAWLRNYVDSTLKTMIDTNSVLDVLRNQRRGRQQLKEYDRALYNIIALKDLNIKKLEEVCWKHQVPMQDLLNDIQLAVVEAKGKALSTLTLASDMLQKYNIAVEDILKMNSSGLFNKQNTEFYFKYLAKDGAMPLEDFQFVHQFIEDSASAGKTQAGEVLQKMYLQQTGQLVEGFEATTNAISSKLLHPMSWIEQTCRFAHHITLAENGVGFAEATARITKAHFDYNLKASINNMMELVFPFYTFKVMNLEYWMDILLDKPWLLRNYMNIQDAAWDIEDYDRYELANNRSLQYAINSGAIPLFKNVTLKLNPSITDVFNLLNDPLGTIDNAMFAPLTSVFESIVRSQIQATDQELRNVPFVGQMLKDKYGSMSELDKLGIVPVVGPTAQRLLQLGPKYAERTDSILPKLFPSIFGATNRWEPKQFALRKFKPKVFSKRTNYKFNKSFKKRTGYLPRLKYMKLWKSYGYDYYKYPKQAYSKKIYPEHMNYYPKWHKIANVYDKYYTKKGMSKMKLMSESTTYKNLKWKIRMMYSYYR